VFFGANKFSASDFDQKRVERPGSDPVKVITLGLVFQEPALINERKKGLAKNTLSRRKEKGPGNFLTIGH
jgi:hypothetical protein